jgi:hypothetical protein
MTSLSILTYLLQLAGEKFIGVSKKVPLEELRLEDYARFFTQTTLPNQEMSAWGVI